MTPESIESRAQRIVRDTGANPSVGNIAFVLAEIHDAILDEREACAKVADNWKDNGVLEALLQRVDIAAAIRARNGAQE